METVGNSDKTAGNNAETVGAGIEETKKQPPKGGGSVSVPTVDKGARRLRARGPPMSVDAKTDTAEKFRAVDDALLPAVDCDALYGASAIARWLGMTIGQCKPLIADDTIPTFRPPGRKALCALKSEINAAFAEYARRFRAKER